MWTWMNGETAVVLAITAVVVVLAVSVAWELIICYKNQELKQLRTKIRQMKAEHAGLQFELGERRCEECELKHEDYDKLLNAFMREVEYNETLESRMRDYCDLELENDRLRQGVKIDPEKLPNWTGKLAPISVRLTE